jgi:thiol-disulfide isomerase/thioredoxin
MKISVRLLAALLVCCLIPQAQAKRAPNLALKDLKGKSRTLSELRGSIVVLNFWATWCGPCREELPMLSRVSREYAGKKVRFIAASADEAKDRAKLDEFMSRGDLGLEVWVGADLDMLERAGLGDELPATLILDEQGEVVSRVLGQAREQDVKAPLEWLLGNKTGPAPQAVVKRQS